MFLLVCRRHDRKSSKWIKIPAKNVPEWQSKKGSKMSTEKIKEIINQYFDNELTKSEEVLLFTQLSQNEETRSYFKEMNFLKSVMEEATEDFPQELENKILSNLKKEEKAIYTPKPISRVANYLSYAFAIILLALSIFFYNESMQYRNKLELTYQQVYQQNQMIQALFNTLPQTEVRGTIENAVIVTPQMWGENEIFIVNNFSSINWL